MPEEANIVKAILQEIRWDSKNQPTDQKQGSGSYKLHEVQFNPETLKVSFSNQLANADDAGGAAIQFTSKGTTKLSVDLIYDITAPRTLIDNQPKNFLHRDVREITKEIVFFMKTTREGEGEKAKFFPPGIRFQWGSFLFEGVMESVNETLELFSADGRPLRSLVSISLVKQDVDIKSITLKGGLAESPSTATTPQHAARQDESLQQMTGRLGKEEKWQDIARANNIENPRMIPIGTLIDV